MDPYEGIWSPPFQYEAYGYQNAGGIQCIPFKGDWSYDAYQFQAIAGSHWQFNTCTKTGDCSCINSTSELGVDVWLFFYEGEFYPDIPCANLVCSHRADSCGNAEFTPPSTNQYVVVVTTQNKGDSGTYNLRVDSDDPNMPGINICNNRVIGETPFQTECVNELSEFDEATTGILRSRTNGTCYTREAGNQFKVDAYEFTVQNDSWWIFSLCDTVGDDGLVMSLYDGSWEPFSIDFCANNTVDVTSYFGNCSIWSQGVISQRLFGETTYTLLVASKSGAGYSEAFETIPYEIDVLSTDVDMNFSCSPIDIPGIDRGAISGKVYKTVEGYNSRVVWGQVTMGSWPFDIPVPVATMKTWLRTDYVVLQAPQEVRLIRSRAFTRDFGMFEVVMKDLSEVMDVPDWVVRSVIHDFRSAVEADGPIDLESADITRYVPSEGDVPYSGWSETGSSPSYVPTDSPVLWRSWCNRYAGTDPEAPGFRCRVFTSTDPQTISYNQRHEAGEATVHMKYTLPRSVRVQRIFGLFGIFRNEMPVAVAFDPGCHDGVYPCLEPVPEPPLNQPGTPEVPEAAEPMEPPIIIYPPRAPSATAEPAPPWPTMVP